MIRLACAVVLSLATILSAQVKPGVDVLRDSKFGLLRGKRIGVVTNQTGLASDGTHLVSLLIDAKLDVVKLFSPEHGLYGLKDEKVGDGVDEKTGLPVVSLYGKSRKPSQEMLAGVDVLVFDIQDVGVRFYTYISTLGLCMEAAAESKRVEVVVLDRPNPLGGLYVDGPIADADKLGFTAYRPIPVCHGMTVGELAAMFNGHFKIGCKLTVIGMTGWKREMLWDDTGLKWVAPSPNLRNSREALLYPAIGLLEATNVSVGRGTDRPFECFGAPWMSDPAKFADELNALNIPGLKFTPTSFTPDNQYHVHHKQFCHGIDVTITDAKALRPVQAGAAIAWQLKRSYPDAWKSENLVKLVQNRAASDAILSGPKGREFGSIWAEQLKAFEAIRSKCLMY